MAHKKCYKTYHPRDGTNTNMHNNIINEQLIERVG